MSKVYLYRDRRDHPSLWHECDEYRFTYFITYPYAFETRVLTTSNEFEAYASALKMKDAAAVELFDENTRLRQINSQIGAECQYRGKAVDNAIDESNKLKAKIDRLITELEQQKFRNAELQTRVDQLTLENRKLEVVQAEKEEIYQQVIVERDLADSRVKTLLNENHILGQINSQLSETCKYRGVSIDALSGENRELKAKLLLTSATPMNDFTRKPAWP